MIGEGEEEIYRGFMWDNLKAGDLSQDVDEDRKI